MALRKKEEGKEAKRDIARGIYKRGGIYWIRYARLDGRIVFESSESEKFKNAEALLLHRINGRQKSARVKSYITSQLVNTFGNLPLRRFNTVIVEQLQTDLMSRRLKNSSRNKVLNARIRLT